jgi:ParB-like chromosome segregation protein Spo0J
VPLLAKSDGSLVDGHLRLKAAKKLGLSDVPVILCDDMSEAQIKAFRISVNKVADYAEWDDELLRLEFDELDAMGFDLELTGFTHQEMFEIITDKEFAPGTMDNQGKLDELNPKMVTCPNCGEEFDSRV